MSPKAPMPRPSVPALLGLGARSESHHSGAAGTEMRVAASVAADPGMELPDLIKKGTTQDGGSRILCITGWFDVHGSDGRPTGDLEFVVSHGVDVLTGRDVVLPCEHPSALGAKKDEATGEWYL